MANWLWKILLGYIFLRPFVYDAGFDILAIILDTIFILSGCLYILKKGIKTATIDRIIIIFLLSLAISIIFSNNFLKSLAESYKYLPLIGLFYITRVADREDKRQLNLILILSAALVSVYSLCHLFILSRFISEYLSNNPNYPFADVFLVMKRAASPFLTANLLANYLVMIIILCLGLTIQKIKDNKKDPLLFLNISCLSISFITLFFTKSIGGWLTLILSISIFFAFAKMLNKKTLSLIFVIFIIFSAVLAMRMGGDKDFTKPTFSVHKRISYWKETVNIIRKDPLTGTGIGDFTLKDTRSAHNSYLQVWAETGLLGIISWLGIIFLFIRKGLGELRYKKVIYYRSGILSSGVAFILHNLIDFGFFSPQVAFLWWIVLGLNQRESQDYNAS